MHDSLARTEMRRCFALGALTLAFTRTLHAQTCAEGPESTMLELACPTGGVITAVTFAQYGLISGSCSSSLAKGSCDADITDPVHQACVGQRSCTLM